MIQKPSSVLQAPNLINGEWSKGSASSVPVVSPYFGEKVGEIFESSLNDIDRACVSAHKAWPEWAKTPLKERCQVMFEFRKQLLQELDAISFSVSLESGKTLSEARAGILKGVEVLEFALSLQNLDEGGKMEVSRGVFCEYRREALGVVAGITPFNFPAMVPMWMIPIALVLGNSFLWKPSDKTPLTSRLIGEALLKAGLPKGVFSIVQGGRSVVEAILDHPLVQAIGFVGSTPIAKAVYSRGSSHGKRVLALGGAKNHIILSPDADVEMAAQGIADSFTGCAGQRCMAASVLIAVGDCEPILKKVEEKVRGIRLGETMGAIITKQSLENLVAAIGRAEKAGARLRVDGREAPPPAQYKNGFWLAPSVLDDVSPDSEAACSELFGPILSIVHAKNLTEALTIENSNPYGNAASVFTSSGAIAEKVIQGARAGMVGVNIGVPVPREPFSFGGFYDSKFGHGDITGPSGVEFWSARKKITSKWSMSNDRNWMS